MVAQARQRSKRRRRPRGRRRAGARHRRAAGASEEAARHPVGAERADRAHPRHRAAQPDHAGVARLCRGRGRHLPADAEGDRVRHRLSQLQRRLDRHRLALSRSAAQPGRGERLGRRARPHRRRLCRLLRRRHGDVDQRAHRRPQAGLLHGDGPRAARRHAGGLRPRRACDEQHPAEDRQHDDHRSTG